MTEKILYVADDGAEFESEEECLTYERTLGFDFIKDDITFWDEHFKKLNIDEEDLADKVFYVKIDSENAYGWFNNLLWEEGFSTLEKCVSNRSKVTGLYFYDSYRDVWKQLEGEMDDLYSIIDNCGLDKFN